MLKSLTLKGVGPVPDLSASFGERLNVLTGDNGLGKSFLLDVCFWALTGTWPGGRTALPVPNGKKVKPSITYEIKGKSQQKKETEPKTASFDFYSQSWTRPKGRPFMPGLVVYAGVDGGFSVWDPARNYWRDPTGGLKDGDDHPRAYQFSPETLAEGLIVHGTDLFTPTKTLCNGLIKDWETWYLEKHQKEQKGPFKYLEEAIAAVSHPLEAMSCVEPRKVYADDAKRFPVVRMPYGDIAYPHWSAGVRRVVSFAYLLVWTWYEHVQAAHLRDEEPNNRLILIVDEIEAHLHPKWQRTILPALLQVVIKLQEHIEVQVFAATHSPLILASLEPHFDKGKDKLFWFDLQEQTVHFRDYPWAIQGDVVGWLTSEIFGLRQARSREGEIAIEAAEAFMRGELDKLPEGLKTKAAIHESLKRALPGLDPYWPRWIVEVNP